MRPRFMSLAHKVMQQQGAYFLGGVALRSHLREQVVRRNEEDPPNLQIVPGSDAVRGSFR